MTYKTFIVRNKKMSSYSKFALFYDRLMGEDINYSHIADYIENLFGHYDISPSLICDLACGTGSVTVEMAKRGYEMIGVDKSVQMLDIARSKAQNSEQDILFLNQSITKLDLFGTCDAFLSVIDGINYILSPKALLDMFTRIKRCFINPDGIFIFDISSKYKLERIVGDNTFIYDKDDIFYTWENRYFKDKRISDMYLNFFVKDRNNYRRFCERHLQRAYSEEEIKAVLKKSGFSDISTFDGYSFEKPTSRSERIVFAAR